MTFFFLNQQLIENLAFRMKIRFQNHNFLNFIDFVAKDNISFYDVFSQPRTLSFSKDQLCFIALLGIRKKLGFLGGLGKQNLKLASKHFCLEGKQKTSLQLSRF